MVKHNSVEKMSVQAFHLSDEEFHAPHQLRPDLPALCTCTCGRYNGVIACGVATTRCSPHEYRPARSQSADTLLYGMAKRSPNQVQKILTEIRIENATYWRQRNENGSAVSNKQAMNMKNTEVEELK